MLEFKDLKCDPAANTLYQEEIDVLMEVVGIVLECAGAKRARGTFILDGQPNDGEAECILRFNLPGWTYHRRFFRVVGKCSTDIAEESIDELLKWPLEKSRYELLNGLVPATGKRLLTGMYTDGELNVMVVNTTHGRFLITANVENRGEEGTLGSYDGGQVADVIMRMMALAITRLCTCAKDVDLRASEGMLWSAIDDRERNFTNAYRKTWQEIERRIFSGEETYETPEAAKAWWAWRKTVSESGEELKLFFQK